MPTAFLVPRRVPRCLIATSSRAAISNILAVQLCALTLYFCIFFNYFVLLRSYLKHYTYVAPGVTVLLCSVQKM